MAYAAASAASAASAAPAAPAAPAPPASARARSIGFLPRAATTLLLVLLLSTSLAQASPTGQHDTHITTPAGGHVDARPRRSSSHLCRGSLDICCRLASASTAIEYPSSGHRPVASSDQVVFGPESPGRPSPFVGHTMKLLRPALAFATAAWCSSQQQHQQPAAPQCCQSCALSSSWPGFSGIKNLFTFGNSYTSTEFDMHGQQPSEDCPMGNPPYPGRTSAQPAENWVGFLTTKYNQSSILNYNLAVGGSTVDRTLVQPFLPIVPTLQDQVRERFVPRYDRTKGTARLARPWHANDTLFAFWFGINDVNVSYQKGPAETGPLNKKIMEAYFEILALLFTKHDMRNVVILNVPSIDRSPDLRKGGKALQQLATDDLADFNKQILHMVQRFKTEVDVNNEANVWVYDSNTDFSKAMDDPKCFRQTSMLKNTTEICEAYNRPGGTPEKDTFLKECGVPVNQYFWLNGLHPTYPIHEAVAAQIAKMLETGPAFC